MIDRGTPGLAFDPSVAPATVAVPRDSATVILARDGAAGPEVFMLERVLTSDFAGGAYVFPGGTFNDGDLDPDLEALTDGITAAMASDLIDAPHDRALAFYLCAIRETFEESGALLARRDGMLVGHDPALDDARPVLNDGSLKLAAFANQHGLRFAADLLLPWSRWITPSAAPKRYDTRFFVAEFPDEDGVLQHDVVESQSSRWIRPVDALAQYKDGAFQIIFPTRVTLTELARYGSVADLLEAAEARDMSPVAPEIVQIDGAVKLLIPGHEDPYDP